MASGENYVASSKSVIETASATTSPDNAHSGRFAYVIALVTMALMGLFGTGMAGCMSLVGEIIGEEVYPPHIEYPYEQQIEEQLDERDYDDFDDYIDDYLNDLYSNDGTGYPFGGEGGAPVDGGGTASVKDILDAELGLYQSTVDNLLPASAYANAQGTVRTFVRDLVIADRDATYELASLLRNAAWSEESPSKALAEASTMAQGMVEVLQGMELPQVEGENASDVSRNLEVGRDKAIERWEAISAELDLLSASDEADVAAVNEADGLVTQAAQDAADAFAQALSDSVRH